jgi:hypothetical protein
VTRLRKRELDDDRLRWVVYYWCAEVLGANQWAIFIVGGRFWKREPEPVSVRAKPWEERGDRTEEDRVRRQAPVLLMSPRAEREAHASASARSRWPRGPAGPWFSDAASPGPGVNTALYLFPYPGRFSSLDQLPPLLTCS